MAHLKNNFNNIYSRPPNFCGDCGDLLDFNVIGEEYIKCQRCDGEILIVSIFCIYIYSMFI